MIVLVTLILFTGVVLIFLVRSKIRADQLQKLARVDTGDSQIEANTFETGHSHTYYVTKDPDLYAKIFVPNRLKK